MFNSNICKEVTETDDILGHKENLRDPNKQSSLVTLSDHNATKAEIKQKGLMKEIKSLENLFLNKPR